MLLFALTVYSQFFFFRVVGEHESDFAAAVTARGRDGLIRFEDMMQNYHDPSKLTTFLSPLDLFNCFRQVNCLSFFV